VSRDERKEAKQSRARLAETTRPLRVELQRIDDRLARLGQEKTEVETLLSQPGAQADDFAEFGRRLAHVQAETAMLEERWLQLQSELEALQASGA
jgi:ATP-binding cassette subfamily F protein 3